MKTTAILIILLSAFNVRADWSESYGGDGVVFEFKMIARILLKEMENNRAHFSEEFTQSLKKEIDETIVTSSTAPLILDGIERDAINHTLVRPYRIEVSRQRWLQYDSSFDVQARLVLHEFLFTLRINDSDYLKSTEIYQLLLNSRMLKNDRNLFGPLFLEAASNCNTIKVSNLLSLGVNPNFTDSENRNALYMAANAGCEALVTQLLSMNVYLLKTHTDSWDPLFAAFMGSLQSGNDSKLFEKYTSIIKKISKYSFLVDSNLDAKFDLSTFPFQLNACDGQTMFMRSLIGVYFFTDETKSDVKFVRNLSVAGILKDLGASLDQVDSCGKSARDYAKFYKIDLNQL